MTTNYFDPKTCIFLQSRADSDPALVEEYAALMADGVLFDSCQGVQASDGMYIWDGYHRGQAAIKSGKLLYVNYRQGSRADAEWLALSANQKHGLRRSSADKRRVVELALKHPNGGQLSDRQIAAHCGVSHPTVAKIREEMQLSGKIYQIETRTATRGDQTYEINTANIGGKSHAPILTQEQRESGNPYAVTECPRCRAKRIFIFPRYDKAGCDGCGAAWQTIDAYHAERKEQAPLGPENAPAPGASRPNRGDGFKIPTIGQAKKMAIDWKCHNCARKIPAGAWCTWVGVNGQTWDICPACLPDFRKRAGLPPVEQTDFTCPRCGGRTGKVNGGAICLDCEASWPTRAEYESELEAYQEDLDAPEMTVLTDMSLDEIETALIGLEKNGLGQSPMAARLRSEAESRAGNSEPAPALDTLLDRRRALAAELMRVVSRLDETGLDKLSQFLKLLGVEGESNSRDPQPTRLPGPVRGGN